MFEALIVQIVLVARDIFLELWMIIPEDVWVYLMKRKDEKTKKKLCPSISWINREGGQSPLVSLPVKNWGFTITSQYFSHAFSRSWFDILVS